MNCTDTFGRVQVRAREGDLPADVASVARFKPIVRVS